MCSNVESCEKDMTNNSQAGKLIGRSMVGKKFLNVLLTLLLIFPAVLASADEKHDPKRVLTIFVFKQGLPWAYRIEESLRTALASETSFPIDLNVEHADLSRFSDKAYLSKLVDLYRYKYSKQQIDLLIAIGDESTDLLIKFGKEFYEHIPVVVITTAPRSLPRQLIRSNIMKLSWGVDLEGTVNLIERILPKTRHLFVVSGSSLTDRGVKRMALKAFGEYAGRLDIQYLSDLTAEDLTAKVAYLPEDSAILFLTFFRDASGKYFRPRDMLSVISEKANAPTFSIVDSHLGQGIVGGRLLSAEHLGRKYADVINRILKDGTLNGLETDGENNFIMFDWRQLKRWSINEDSLPIGSIVRYREQSIWEDHKGKILGAIAIILAQTSFLLFLLTQRAKRSRAEKGLRQSEEKYQDLYSNAPDMFVSVAAKTTTILECNQTLANALGYKKEEIIGRLIFDIYTPDSAKHAKANVFPVFMKTGTIIEEELQLQRKDGSALDVSLNVSAARDEKGDIIYSRSVLRDITERKQSELQILKAHSEIKQLKDRIEAESVYLQEEIKLEHNFDNIIGQSESLSYVLYRVEQVAGTDSPVFIYGETGTGKELIARAIHQLSPRNQRALVKVNCAALPGDLIESELFGREKGAYSGAVSSQLGRFELAHGSTLFLDEIGEMPFDLQAKLLRVLESGEFEKLGNPKTLHSDARIIAATNRNLEEEVSKGRFRQDLWYRLNIFPITLPPLRERRDDIPLLVKHFMDHFAKKLGKPEVKISKETMQRLQDYTWPGNVRELEHTIENALITTRGEKLKFDLPIISDDFSSDFKSLAEMEIDYLLKVLKAKNWKIEGADGAAQTIGMHPNTLRNRMNKLGIKRPKP